MHLLITFGRRKFGRNRLCGWGVGGGEGAHREVVHKTLRDVRDSKDSK